MTEGRDFWWDEEAAKVPSYCPCEPVAAEDPLFILYVSTMIQIPPLSESHASHVAFSALSPLLSVQVVPR
jgi:hypothetical protein